jgi:3-oxoacyl-[acyl-carrier protein] reductase
LDIDVDYLVLNAGVTKDNIFLRMSAEEWSSVIDVNLNSSFYLLKHFVKKMVKKRFGRIVFISSVVAHTGNPGQANYTSSKAAISGMVKSLALELSSRNISVNAVAPGFIASNMTDKLNDNQKNSILDRIPMKRLGAPQDIAKAVGFLCSENASYITGQTIHVNGGLALI